ncbi:hypothetical protein [Thalassotalea montiporae]
MRKKFYLNNELMLIKRITGKSAYFKQGLSRGCQVYWIIYWSCLLELFTGLIIGLIDAE